MYSDYYDPSVNTSLTPANVADIYRRETMHITRRGEFMGIWQMHALASILGAQLVSIYPQRGNPVIRKHLHRTLEPRERRSSQTVHIMWTSTREQTNTNCFFPNHFVPLVHTKKPKSSAHLMTILVLMSLSTTMVRFI